MADAKDAMDDASSVIIDVNSDGGYKLKREERTIELQPEDTPGFCFAVSAGDHYVASEIIRGICGNPMLLAADENGVYDTNEVFYKLTHKSGEELRLIFPQDYKHERVKCAAEALNKAGISYAPANFYYDRSPESYDRVHHSINKEAFFPETSDNNEQLFRIAINRGIITGQKPEIGRELVNV